MGLTKRDHKPTEEAALPDILLAEIAPQITVMIAKPSMIEPQIIEPTAVLRDITILTTIQFQLCSFWSPEAFKVLREIVLSR